MNRRLALLSVLFTGCVNLELPPPPQPPGPGTVQGVAVYAEPGRADFRPAAGAQVEVLGTGLSAVADAQGRFLVSGVVRARGAMVVTLGQRSVLVQLESVGAGPGRDVALGEVVLSRNGAAIGRVTREGNTGTTGLGGTTVFVPNSPWATYTADDGSFRLEGLPAGALQVAFFISGFAPASLDVTLGAGEERTLPTLALERAPIAPASVTGLLLKGDGAPAADARARARLPGMEQALSVNGEGRFSGTGLTSGVYTFGFERTGSRGITVQNTLVAPGENDLGTLQFADGEGPSLMLTGLDPWVNDAGPADAGHTDAGPDDAGVLDDAGTPDAGMPDAGMPDAGMPDAGMPDAGMPDAGMPDAGMPDAGMPDAGMPDAGMPDAGMPDAGSVDAGLTPIAFASGPAFAAPGTQVTLSGSSSSGDFPLIYRWVQTGGPAVTLNVNDTALAHSPRFTAPAAGAVIAFTLVVEDRVGVRSAPATVAVPIGVRPIARFTPDAGLVFGGQTLQLTSTSVDDAGVALVSFGWQLVAGSGGTLVTDGGPVALWQTPAVAFNAPDVVGGVTLQVANAVGISSAPTTSYFTVRGTSPNNWSLDAGPTQALNVGATPPQVVLSGSVTAAGISNPQYAVSWACPPSITLIGADTLSPRFIAPVVVGRPVSIVCRLTATGQPPLDPPVIIGDVVINLNDTAPPTLTYSSVDSSRLSRFGFVARASEPLSDASFAATGWGSYGVGTLVSGNWARAEQGYGSNDEGEVLGPVRITMTDTALTPQTSANVAMGPATNLPVQALWSGPYESTATFVDPRPVVAGIGPFPRGQQEQFGVTPGSASLFEVLATEGGQLVRFTGIDPWATPACSPSCALASSVTLSGLTPDRSPSNPRAHFAGAELFVSTSTDGGIPVTVRRSPSGTWSTFTGLTGQPASWNDGLRSVRVQDTSVYVDTWNPQTQTFTPTDLAMTGVDAVNVASIEDVVTAAVGPTRQFAVVMRNRSTLQWSSMTPTTPVQNVVTMIPLQMTSGISATVVELADAGVSVVRHDSSGRSTLGVTGGPVVGVDGVSFGGVAYVVYAINGDIRFVSINGQAFGGSGGARNFGGPPRVGFTAPYPVMLDVNPLCEAAYPRMTFVEDALIITWQERCSPETRWKVMSRVVR